MWRMTKGQIILAAIVTFGFILVSILVVLTAYGNNEIPESLEKFWLMIFTAWTVNFTTIINWNFGSSKSSADKTALLSNKPDAIQD